jgi:hypothetical protein
LNHFSLGSIADARINTDDFAIFLHSNPGARRVWETRESRLAEQRKKIEIDLEEETISYQFPYVEWVKQALVDLDQEID